MSRCPSHNEPNSTLSGSLVCKIKASVLRPFQMTQQGNSLISTVSESLLFLNCPATLHQKPYFPLISVAQLLYVNLPKNVKERREQLKQQKQQMGDISKPVCFPSELHTEEHHCSSTYRVCFCGAALSTINISHAEMASTLTFILSTPWGGAGSASPEPHPPCNCVWEEEERGKEWRRPLRRTQEVSLEALVGFLFVYSSGKCLLKCLCWVMTLGSSETFASCLKRGEIVSCLYACAVPLPWHSAVKEKVDEAQPHPVTQSQTELDYFWLYSSSQKYKLNRRLVNWKLPSFPF